MNIFVLDLNPELAAQYHCDKHVVKMVTETAQLLCSVYYFTGQADFVPYRLTHISHPCSKWVRSSRDNWIWLCKLGIYLYYEYQYRYNKIHKAGEVILDLTQQLPRLESLGMTPFPLCMPEYCIVENDPVASYRNYYRLCKKDLLVYTRRPKPFWL